jgi:hypothetical protein
VIRRQPRQYSAQPRAANPVDIAQLILFEVCTGLQPMIDDRIEDMSIDSIKLRCTLQGFASARLLGFHESFVHLVDSNAIYLHHNCAFLYSLTAKKICTQSCVQWCAQTLHTISLDFCTRFCKHLKEAPEEA